MDRQIVIYPYKGILLNNKGNEVLIHAASMNLKIIMQSEKEHTKRVWTE